MSKEVNRVVVLSRNYSTGLSVIRSLGAAGYKIDLIASAVREDKSNAIAKSKYVDSAVEIVSSKVSNSEDTALVQALLSYKDRYDYKPVLIPTDDYTASVMDSNREALKEIFLMPGIRGGESLLTKYMNKNVQCDIAVKTGMPAPKCHVVSLRARPVELPEGVTYPAFAKPIESFTGYKQEMKRCDSEEELKAHLDHLSEVYPNRDFLVQEYVDIDQEIDIEGVCNGENIYLTGVVWKEIVARYERGVPLAGDLRPFDEFPGLQEKVEKLLKAFDYFGMFDLGINIVGGEYYFNELNLRSGGTNFVYFASGVNLPELFVKLTQGSDDAKKIPTPEFGKKYLYEKMGYEDYLHGYLAEDTLRDWENKADIKFFVSEIDPEPGELFMSEMKSRVATKKFRDSVVSDMMDATGMSYDDAKASIEATKVETGINYREFKRYHLWDTEPQDRGTVYEKRKAQRKERVKNREEAISKAIEDNGWDRERATDDIKQAVDRCGVSYRDYNKYEFWKLSPEEQDKEYKRITRKREKKKERRESCVAAMMKATHVSRDEAFNTIKDARHRLGIKYKEYEEYEFWQYSEAEQEEIFKEILKAREEKRKTHKKRKGQKVVVLSRNYSTGLSVIRSLGFAGCDVDLVASALRPGRSELAAKSKFVDEWAEVVSKKVKNADDHDLVSALLEYDDMYEQKPVLLPTDDYTASVMDVSRELLEDIFVMPGIVGGKAGSLVDSMNKSFQSMLAKKAGLPTPKEWEIDLDNEIAVPDDMAYPCFCKPTESISGYKSEMAKLDDEEELIRHLKKLKKKFARRSVLIQEYLEIESEVDLSGVCLDDKVIIPAVIRKTAVAQHEKGVTLAGQVVSNDYIKDVYDAVIRMMQSFRYFGMFDMELNIVDGKFYFNEVNLRSGGPYYSYFKSGANLAALFVKEALGDGHDPEDEKVESLGKHFIYEKVAWDDYIFGLISKRELKDLINKADINILYDEADPVPGEVFEEGVKRKHRRAKIRKIKNLVKWLIRLSKRIFFPPMRAVKHMLLRYPQANPFNRRKKDSGFPRIMVSGRNYSTNLSIARSLGEAGYEVEVLKIFQKRPKKTSVIKKIKPDAYSKYVKAYHVCVSNRRSRRIVNRFIKLADDNRKMILIPADDLIANIIDDYMDELCDYYILPGVNGEAGGVTRLMAKDVQKSLAREYGLPIVNSHLIKTTRREFDIPEGIKYPCFVKPNISRYSAKSRMKRCDTEMELRNHIEEISMKKDVEMLAEDYVDIAKEYSILGLCLGDKVIAPGLFAADRGGHEEHRGVAITGKMLPVHTIGKLYDDLLGFMGTLGYTGLFDIDLIEDTSGRMYFVEINMRFGASGYALTECGANLPGMYADKIYRDIEPDIDINVDDNLGTFVSEKVMIEEYLKGRLEKSDMESMMEEADHHFVKNDQDPRPYRHFRHYVPLVTLARRLAERKNDGK